MHNFRLICIIGAVIMITSQGCSINAVIKQPPPLPVEKAKVGYSRAQLIALFGSPTHTEVHNPGRTDLFEFVDGYHGAGKMRVILYLAADVFTLGLAEFLLWPLEKGVGKGREGTAIADYDKNNISTMLTITDRDGNSW